MSALLDELYYTWLYSQICSLRLKNPARTYHKLFRLLFTHEFVWFVPNDDNRVEDGRDLRYECLEENGYDPDDVDQDWLKMGCSCLELLIGLSRRLAFETSGDPGEWFWEMLENLELSKYSDKLFLPDKQIRDVLDQVIWRTYRWNGDGGLFPLQKASSDQRDVELWYQLMSYIEERA